jgi:membrane-bound inhibitor of C-type lysozyme
MKKLVALLVVIVALAVGIFVLATRHNTPRPISTVTYACDNNMTITAAYYEGPKQPPVPAGQMPQPTGSAVVSLDGEASTTFKQTISADGARYANSDESLVFWSKGNQVLILRNNSTDLSFRNCTAR